MDVVTYFQLRGESSTSGNNTHSKDIENIKEDIQTLRTMLDDANMRHIDNIIIRDGKLYGVIGETIVTDGYSLGYANIASSEAVHVDDSINDYNLTFSTNI